MSELHWLYISVLCQATPKATPKKSKVTYLFNTLLALKI